jgi:hypothetical protein
MASVNLAFLSFKAIKRGNSIRFCGRKRVVSKKEMMDNSCLLTISSLGEDTGIFSLFHSKD